MDSLKFGIPRGRILEIRVIPGSIDEIETDAIAVSVFEDGKQLSDVAAAIDEALEGTISSLLSRGEAKGKFGEVSIVHTFGKLPARIVAVVGLGKHADLSLDKLRGKAGELCRTLRRLNCRSMATMPFGAGENGIGVEAAVETITEGTILGLYSFTRYKKPEYQDIEAVTVAIPEMKQVQSVESAVRKGKLIAEATNLARDMVNEPANYMTPSQMAEVAKSVANHNNLEIKILEREDMEGMRMGAFLGVAQGSNQPAKLITLSYKGNGRSQKAIGFIGKGITFDSGGISIKPSEGMEEMKSDMAGAAAVIGAIAAIAQLKPAINVTAIVAATENLPSGTALKPGDVLKAMNGKTIEVISTDAEGRLTLADALSYAQQLGLSPLIDLATLTGACRIALGTLYSGLFGNDQAFANRVLMAAETSGERIWQMPMPDEYKELNKSEVANIKNGGNRLGGAITAALFLAEFVADVPWVHIDIAGTAFSTKETGYTVKGATGVGVRTLVELALSEARNQEAV
jgi:leucyl aminopeptidase